MLERCGDPASRPAWSRERADWEAPAAGWEAPAAGGETGGLAAGISALLFALLAAGGLVVCYPFIIYFAVALLSIPLFLWCAVLGPLAALAVLNWRAAPPKPVPPPPMHDSATRTTAFVPPLLPDQGGADPGTSRLRAPEK